MPDDISWDALAEIGLEGVDTLVQKRGQLGAVPSPGPRVGEVDDTHAWLPLVALPWIAVLAL